MKAKALGVISSILLFSSLIHSVHASPVAMASNLVGKPEVRQSGGSWKSLVVLQRLSPGDVVRCGPNAEAVVMMFTNGVRYKLSHNQQGTVQSSTVKGASIMGGMGGANIRVAKAMTGLDTQPFMARKVGSHQRLDRNIPGYQNIDIRTFTWDPLDEAAEYTFTLFDQNNNVVWSIRQPELTAEVPAALPAFQTKRPYVWRLSGFGKSGKPVLETRWGILTFLTSDNIAEMNSEIAALNSQLNANTSDITPLLLQAEVYRQYAVYEGVLATLEDDRLHNQPGILSAQEDAYTQVGPLAVLLSHNK